MSVHEKCDGHCGDCGREISIKEMQVDHMYPFHVGCGNDMENLMPSCRQCNHYKRGATVEMFRISLRTLHERVGGMYIHKVAVNFGLAEIKAFDGLFYFEKQAK